MKVLALYFALEALSALVRFVRTDEGIVKLWRKAADDPDYLTVYRIQGVIGLAFAAWFFFVVWR